MSSTPLEPKDFKAPANELTVLDVFAGLALLGYIAGDEEVAKGVTYDDLATWAYDMAEAMLQVRKDYE